MGLVPLHSPVELWMCELHLQIIHHLLPSFETCSSGSLTFSPGIDPFSHSTGSCRGDAYKCGNTSIALRKTMMDRSYCFPFATPCNNSLACVTSCVSHECFAMKLCWGRLHKNNVGSCHKRLNMHFIPLWPLMWSTLLMIN